ncbi:MAG TPA: ROK family transcriptional regulator [Armatimonadota bacterium]|nr:ROK family transcriptional regulator [Armatimonadota bacterium]
MTNPSLVQPALLSKMNERQVLRAIQSCGPLSRAEVARHSGISAPTASKAVEALLRAGLLEEGDPLCLSRGRPARKLRLASDTAQVLGLVIDAEQCRLVSAGLDGKLHDAREEQFATPSTYEALLHAAADAVTRMIAREGVATLGLAISIPGLIDYREQRGVLSPNLPFTDGRYPGRDLADRLGIECLIVQESHALCLAERRFGAARGIDDFAMLDVSTGVGLGVMCGGRLLRGHSGLAGEIGHLTVELDGRTCGCGNRGCLETVASDSALAWSVSQRLGRKVSVEEVLELIRQGEAWPREELQRTCRYLAVALAAVINLFDPSTLFVHGRLFEADPTLFSCVVEEARKRSLPPSFADCRIIQARGSKRQGAVAAIIEHLTNSVVPALSSDATV